MNPYRKLLIFVLLCTMLVSGCASQAGRPITEIVAFGDDLADNGNGYRISKKDIENKVEGAIIIPPSNLYWEGRGSNGPISAEVMAQRMQAELTTYAVIAALSGCCSIHENTGEYTVTGLQSQVIQFENELNGKKADPDALYLVFQSTMDDFWWYQEKFKGRSTVLADNVLLNIKKVVTKLAGLGAKRFMVVNSIDQVSMPYYAVEKNEDLPIFQSYYQTQLPKIMADLGKQSNIEITVFDLQAISDQIRSDPQKYGLKNINDPCMLDYWATTACENPDEYFFWDPFHPTRVVQQIYGEAMAAVYGK